MERWVIHLPTSEMSMVMFTLLSDLYSAFDRPLGRDVLDNPTAVQTRHRLAEMKRNIYCIHPSVMQYITMGLPGSMVVWTSRYMRMPTTLDFGESSLYLGSLFPF